MPTCDTCINIILKVLTNAIIQVKGATRALLSQMVVELSIFRLSVFMVGELVFIGNPMLANFRKN